MSQCNIQGAIKYLEDLHAQLDADGHPTAPFLLRDIFSPVLENMIAVRHASSFAGVGHINIHKPYDDYVEKRTVTTPADNSQLSQAPETDSLADLDLGKVYSLPVTEFMDVIDQVAVHVDNTRSLYPDLKVQENVSILSEVVRKKLNSRTKPVKVRLVPSILSEDGRTEPLVSYDDLAGVIDIAVSPNESGLSIEAFHEPAARMILGELVRDIVNDGLQREPELAKQLRSLQDRVTAEYRKKFKVDPPYPSGTTSLGDFAASILLSPEVQESLVTLSPAKKRSIVQRVKALFNQLLDTVKKRKGIDPKEHTLLDDALEVMDKLMQEPTTPSTSNNAVEALFDKEVNGTLDGDDPKITHSIKAKLALKSLKFQDKAHQAIAKSLVKYLPDDLDIYYVDPGSSKLVTHDDGQQALGTYNHDDRALYIMNWEVDDQTNTELHLHEFMHYVLWDVAMAKGGKTAEEKQLFNHIQDVFRKAKKAATPEQLTEFGYAFGDVQEFLAMGLTNKNFMEFLSTVETKTDKSLLSKLAQALVEYLGMSSKSATALEELFHVYGKVLGAPDPEVADATPTDFEPYSINGKYKTNKGQTEAINAVMDWFKGAKRGESFLLQGRGGTGKTTVINVLLRELGLSPGQVMFAAPTNKAKKVIEIANKGTDYGSSDYRTVAQILSIKPIRMRDGTQIFVTDEYATPIELPPVLVVDEVSMLKSDDYDNLMYRAAETGTKVIFMGDHAQMPPVKDPKALIKSKAFDDNKDTSTALTQLMRQGEDSPIISFTNRLITEVETVEEALEANTPPNKVKQALRTKTFDGNVYNQMDSEGNGVVLTNESFEDIIPSFIDDYKKNPRTTKYILFNNHHFPATLRLVQRLREKLHGEKAVEERFIKGEPLMLNSPLTIDLDADSLEKLDSGEEFTVVSSEVVSKRIPYKVGKETYTSQEELSVYEITATDNITGGTVVFNKPTGNKATVDAFVNSEKAFWVSKGQKADRAYRLEDVLATHLEHGYLINGHRSQGSTYDTVYMDLGNIMGQPYAGGNDLIKSMYVAASRPRTRLVVMDSRSRGGAIVNPSKVQQPDDRPYMFGDIDIAEVNDIIAKVDKCKGDK